MSGSSLCFFRVQSLSCSLDLKYTYIYIYIYIFIVVFDNLKSPWKKIMAYIYGIIITVNHKLQFQRQHSAPLTASIDNWKSILGKWKRLWKQAGNDSSSPSSSSSSASSSTFFSPEFLCCCYLFEHAWKTLADLPAYLMSTSVISTTFFFLTE